MIQVLSLSPIIRCLQHSMCVLSPSLYACMYWAETSKTTEQNSCDLHIVHLNVRQLVVPLFSPLVYTVTLMARDNVMTRRKDYISSLFEDYVQSLRVQEPYTECIYDDICSWNIIQHSVDTKLTLRFLDLRNDDVRHVGCFFRPVKYRIFLQILPLRARHLQPYNFNSMHSFVLSEHVKFYLCQERVARFGFGWSSNAPDNLLLPRPNLRHPPQRAP